MPTVAAKKQPAVGGDREASQWMPPAAYLAEQGSTGSLPQAPKVPPPSEAPPPPSASPPPPPVFEGHSSSPLGENHLQSPASASNAGALSADPPWAVFSSST